MYLPSHATSQIYPYPQTQQGLDFNERIYISRPLAPELMQELGKTVPFQWELIRGYFLYASHEKLLWDALFRLAQTHTFDPTTLQIRKITLKPIPPVTSTSVLPKRRFWGEFPEVP